MDTERRIVFLGCTATTRATLCAALAGFGFHVKLHREPERAARAALDAGLGNALLVIDLPWLAELGVDPHTLPPRLGEVIPLALLVEDAADPAVEALVEALAADEVLDGREPLETLLFQLHESFFRKRGLRRAPRLRVDLMVEVRHGDGLALLQALNISSGGMYLRTLQPRRAGERLRLRFPLPDREQPVELVGQVVYAIGLDHATGSLRSHASPDRPVLGHPGMGIRFVDVPEELSASLRLALGE